MKSRSHWKPSAPIANLLKRASIIDEIRQFFKKLGLLEVETPSISQATVTDIHLAPFQTFFFGPDKAESTPLYLTTSPEHHMKRLLAAGSGPIFQICHSFRNKEIGRYHNPEFTMLEWYRPDSDIHFLMNELDELLKMILNCNGAEKIPYQQVFLKHVGIDPLSADRYQLYSAVIKHDLIEASSVNDDCDTLLQLLFSIIVEPNIGYDKPIFVYHFPASQAGMAEICTHDYRVANRFEAYFKGIELANGFQELTDACEQHKRFKRDNYRRVTMQLNEQPIDKNLLAALIQGMPKCSGIALGLDRLIMLALKEEHINDVIAFSIDRA